MHINIVLPHLNFRELKLNRCIIILIKESPYIKIYNMLYKTPYKALFVLLSVLV